MTPPKAPVFTEAQIKEDGQNRVAKTAGQAGAAGALVIVGNWAAHQAGWNGELPIEVGAAMQLLLTTIAGWLTNLRRLRGVA